MKNIFVISVEDVQCLAEHEVGRALTTEELKSVKKDVNSGLECWSNVVIDAIKITIKE